MKRLILLSIAAIVSASFSASHAGGLKDLGSALAYPVKKDAHNTGKSVRTGAGTASRGINHGAQSVQYPIRKSGENTSKTTHKFVGK